MNKENCALKLVDKIIQFLTYSLHLFLSSLWFKRFTKIPSFHFNILFFNYILLIDLHNSPILQILAFPDSYFILFTLSYLLCYQSGLYKRYNFASLPTARIAGRTENFEPTRSVSYPSKSLFCWGYNSLK